MSTMQVIEACWATREASGGLMELSTLLRFVRRASPSSEGLKKEHSSCSLA